MFSFGPESNPRPDIIGDADGTSSSKGSGRWRRYRVAGGGIVLAGIVAAVAISLTTHHPANRPSGEATPRVLKPVALVPSALVPVPTASWVQSLSIGTWPPQALTSGPSSGGVFALGVAGPQHGWQLEIRDIARPGQRCVPGVTLNGAHGHPVVPRPPMLTRVGNLGFIAPGSHSPGVGVAFVQVPASAQMVLVDPAGIGGLGIDNVLVVTVTACGEEFHVAGFAYPLAGTLDLSVPLAGSPRGAIGYAVPPSLSRPRAAGVWQFG